MQVEWLICSQYSFQRSVELLIWDQSLIGFKLGLNILRVHREPIRMQLFERFIFNIFKENLIQKFNFKNILTLPYVILFVKTKY